VPHFLGIVEAASTSFQALHHVSQEEIKSNQATRTCSIGNTHQHNEED